MATLTETISKLNKRIRRMAFSEFQTNAFRGLQHRLAANKWGKREIRNDKEVFTFTQKNLTAKQKERLIAEVNAYEKKPTIKEEREARKLTAQTLAEFYNEQQERLGTKKRIKVTKDAYINKLWKVYNRMKVEAVNYSSDEVIDYIKMNIKESQKQLREEIEKAIEKDESLVDAEHQKVIRKRRINREKEKAKKAVKF